MTESTAIVQAEPAWIAPPTPEPQIQVVGINADGELYLYGETARNAGPAVPAIVGYVADIYVSQHGAGSRYGLRDYLDVRLGTPNPGEQVILRLPCYLRPSKSSPDGEQQTPYSVRSLLAGLDAVDLRASAVKLQTVRGRETTFIRVFPYAQDGSELPEVRAQAIPGSRDDLEIAVNHLRSSLGLQPQFISPHDQ